MRRLVASTWLLLPFAVACGPLFAVVPQNHAPYASAQGNGVSLTATADQWSTAPTDLADRVTPIQVIVRNDGATPIAVALADFELYDVDNDGGQALNPFVVPIAQLSPEQQDVLAAPKLAFRGFGGFRGGGFRGGFGVRGGYRGGVRWAPSRRYYGPRVIVRPGWRSRGGFWIAGGLRGWYGPSYPYWGGAWYGPAGSYSTYADGGWSAPEVVQYALPEGVLQPGGEVRGFVYFQRLTSDRSPTVRLRYKPRDANTGALAPPLELALDVVRN